MLKVQNWKTLIIAICALFSQWCIMKMVNYRFALWSAVVTKYPGKAVPGVSSDLQAPGHCKGRCDMYISLN